jgi:hypothetical protein
MKQRFNAIGGDASWKKWIRRLVEKHYGEATT